MNLARIYLRASTSDQDATRARSGLVAFAEERGLMVAGTYIENESGAKLARPALWRLLDDSKAGDLLIVEQIDRLSRLSDSDWRKLRHEIESRGVRVVALDLPTSWLLVQSEDEFSVRMAHAVNGMMMDMLAAVARKDYSDRRRRQAEGQAKCKATGGYTGRPEDTARNGRVAKMLGAGMSWADTMATVGCSRATVAKVAARLRAADVQAAA